MNKRTFVDDVSLCEAKQSKAKQGKAKQGKAKHIFCIASFLHFS